ncbi:hypothetical protein KIN20_009644 [Parelaphostrongylus tenuis]|uniref:Pseudouridine synthase RsuA/RluA-like domain-containing protein n=1 Tax=Parelaphostrongylus tenuis TaxID=148309 RepID=A0AAD5MBG0_PARTN|nr:hypothetical protein KIN20_009644 [Parelaphostrongylus tenuis]
MGGPIPQRQSLALSGPWTHGLYIFNWQLWTVCPISSTSLIPSVLLLDAARCDEMSKNLADDDDFFGIKCFSSDLNKSDEKAEAVEVTNSSGKTAVTKSVRRHSVNDDSVVEKDDSELSGTEYLDRTPISANIENEEEQPKDFFEESFFRRVKSVEASITSSEIRSQHENSQDHKRIKRKDSAKILHEENMDFYTKLRQSSAVKGSRNESFPNDYDSEVIHSPEEETGWDKIRRQFIPVWKMSPDELVDLMVNRVLFKNDDIVAFDKPYGMAYSGASSTVPQLDRLLQRIKAKVVPKCERLYLVRSLDKYQSGIVLFATRELSPRFTYTEDAWSRKF